MPFFCVGRPTQEESGWAQYKGAFSAAGALINVTLVSLKT